MTGKVSLDSNRDRDPICWLWGLEPGGEEFEHFADIDLKDTEKPVRKHV